MKDKNKGIELICGTTGKGRSFSMEQLEKLYNFTKKNRKVIILNDPVEYEIKTNYKKLNLSID